MENQKDSKKTKKNRRKLKILVVGSLWLLVVFLSAMLLLDKPSGYNPQNIKNDKCVSPYVTNELAPYVYNSIQKSQPFDIIIPQSKTKEFISLIEWPIESENVIISAPQAFFIENGLVIRANAQTQSLNFVITLLISGSVDQNGLMNLSLDKIMIGSMNITFIAKIIAKKMYQHKAKQENYSKDTIGADIAASLLNDQPFDPVFEVRKRKVKITQLSVEKSQLKITLVPVVD